MVVRSAKKSKRSGAQPSSIRVLHHLARSGGTVISKCLATMEGIVLLSEIHPSGMNLFNPLRQFHDWYGLFTKADIQSLQKGIGFVEGIALINQRCVDNGKTLVLRDWTHLDFTAVPFLPGPSYRLTMVDQLRQRFAVINTATVRHPIPQWLSLNRLPIMRGKLTLDMYLEGSRRFAEECVRIGFVRYEDFTAEPESQLGILCERLSIAYDGRWRDRWYDYTNISGDQNGARGKEEIVASRLRVSDRDLLAAFARNPDYCRTLEILGYEHPPLCEDENS